MSGLGEAMAWSGAVVGGAMLSLWLLSVRLRNASIVDPFWGTGFVLVAWVSHAAAGAGGLRAWLAILLASAWGLRLSAHLLRRSAGHGEDFRYAAMRAAHGERFRWVSLFTVFLLQGALLWTISLPLQVAVTTAGRPAGAIEVAAGILWAAGFAFEAIADRQLTRFRADPGSRGRVLDSGLWRYTRHPNYFGDALQWWAFGLLGVGAGAPWTLLSPALMTFLLVRVSGVALLERDIAQRRPGYREYAERTSAFFPRPPRPGRAPQEHRP